MVTEPTPRTVTDPALRTRDVWRSFGTGDATVHAVQGVDLDVERGEFLALMGPSGCGKSTLLHLLGGLDLPSRGEIHVDGQQLDLLDESQRAVVRRRTIGFVFQAYNLVPNLTVADNVDLPGLLAGRPAREVARRRGELLELLGITQRASSLPTTLSGGQQQRAAIARAVINEPTVLLGDEPTGNLDSASGAQVLDLLRELHGRGQTLVVVTHDPLVASHAGRVLFLRDGRVIDELRPDRPGDGDTVLERLAALATRPAGAEP